MILNRLLIDSIYVNGKKYDNVRVKNIKTNANQQWGQQQQQPKKIWIDRTNKDFNELLQVCKKGVAVTHDGETAIIQAVYTPKRESGLDQDNIHHIKLELL